ncbi:hypothetical protein Acsp02_48230 [Actinoplanes sp. NBRC 103695]|nr:hypothetical protein Acsp02_48230 [Actinoplanes sp. NBRC 103695]
MPPGAVPAETDARAALYRTVTADKRLLVVLDNARDGVQVAALLPRSATCTVLVTSRSTLTGLIAGHGVEPVGLDVLDGTEARALLSARLGEDRLAEDAPSVTAVISACGGLPLALGIAASRTAVRPRYALPAVADELTDTGTRLAALEGDPPHTGLRAVLSWSYAALAPREARVLLLTALAPGADVSVLTVAALSGLPEHDALVALHTLHRFSLLGEQPGRRWKLHDLVRLYLTERAGQELTEDDRETSLRRLLDFYLLTATEGDRILNPTRRTSGRCPKACGPFQSPTRQPHCPGWTPNIRGCWRRRSSRSTGAGGTRRGSSPGCWTPTSAGAVTCSTTSRPGRPGWRRSRTSATGGREPGPAALRARAVARVPISRGTGPTGPRADHRDGGRGPPGPAAHLSRARHGGQHRRPRYAWKLLAPRRRSIKCGETQRQPGRVRKYSRACGATGPRPSMSSRKNGRPPRVRRRLLRPSGDLVLRRKTQADRTAKVVIAGHAFVQNPRRGHYELGVKAHPALRLAAAFTELAAAI